MQHSPGEGAVWCAAPSRSSRQRRKKNSSAARFLSFWCRLLPPPRRPPRHVLPSGNSCANRQRRGSMDATHTISYRHSVAGLSQNGQGLLSSRMGAGEGLKPSTERCTNYTNQPNVYHAKVMHCHWLKKANAQISWRKNGMRLTWKIHLLVFVCDHRRALTEGTTRKGFDSPRGLRVVKACSLAPRRSLQ